MNSRRSQTSIRPPAALQKIVERALAGNADSVELEPVPEGLEVCWRVGNTGLGTVFSNEGGNRITRFIVRAAGLERHDKGVMTINVAGERHEISVEIYEHFTFTQRSKNLIASRLWAIKRYTLARGTGFERSVCHRS